MKKYSTVIMILLFMVLMIGCSKKSEEIDLVDVTPTSIPTKAPTATPTPEPTPEPENHDGEVRSKLTGLWVPEDIGNQRPFAIMINNLKLAYPQSGTSEASILYEAIVEGGITRLMGIYEDLNDTRIGSVRSARHYFVSFADEYDAIFVHYGETTYATKKIKSLNIDNLSGLTGIEPTVYYRDKSIGAPHNAFTSKEGLIAGATKLGYNLEYDEDYESHFVFYEEDTELKSEESIQKITLNFSNYASPYFVYDKDNKVYERFSFDQPHIDINSGEQLEFKNIIVQFVKEWDIDKNDYQTMDIENASGTGYYITNGKKVNITWKKNESTRIMRYYDEEGNVLSMNSGKTYIAIFPNNQIEGVVFE